MSAEVIHFPVRSKPLTPALEIFFTGLHGSAQRFVIASSERFTVHPLLAAQLEALISEEIGAPAPPKSARVVPLRRRNA